VTLAVSASSRRRAENPSKHLTRHPQYVERWGAVQYLVLDQGSDREIVEQVGEDLPHLSTAKLAQTLIIKTISARTA
jgi:hypothetical protein